LLWVVRSGLRDLRGRRAAGEAVPIDATGLHSASALHTYDVSKHSPRLVVERAPGHDPGMIYDLDGDLLLGRGDEAEIRLEDPFASSRHARIFSQGGILAIEDLSSTNGTYLNEEPLRTPRPLHPGDRVRIGDSEFTFEVD
jgi:hypothetical protein